SSLPELTPEPIRALLMEAGVAPLQGLPDGLFALDSASRVSAALRRADPVRLVAGAAGGRTLSEAEGKSRLADAGLPVPESRTCSPDTVVETARDLAYPLVLKAASAELAHKTEAGGVALDLRDETALAAAAKRLGRIADRLLVERMIDDGVAEVLVGVERDGQFGLTLTLASGGTLTELLRDPVLLLFPVDADAIRKALRRLTIWPLLNGFRGRPAADVDTLVETIMRVAGFAESLAPRLAALEINPLIVRPAGHGVVAADCLMTLLEET
ncbi:MAG: acetate--CoA ligase family protein, partial [Pseudomonadota bacterium]